MKLNKKTRKKIMSALQIVFIFLLTVGIAGYFSYLGVDPHHDGIILKPASDVARGQMLFRDTFNQYGALTTIIQSWALAVFGHYLIVINLLTVFFYGLIAIMLWLIWSLFLPEFLTTLACLIWLFLAPYHHSDYYFLPWASVYSLFFQLVTLYALLRFLQTKRNLWQIIAGVSTGLTFWSRQPVGFLLIGSIIFYFLVLRFKRYKMPSVKPFFVSYVGVHAIFFIWIVTNNAFFDWFKQTIYVPGMWAATGHDAISMFFFLMGNVFPKSDSPISIWTLMPLAILYLGFTNITKRSLNMTYARILLVVCISIASWLQYHPVNDPRHLYWAAAPMVGFCFYASLQLSTDKKRSLTILVICIALFVPDIVNHARLARRKIRKYWAYPILTRPEVLRGMKVPPIEKRFFDEAMDQIEKYEKINPHSFITTTAMDALYSLFDGKNKNCYKLTVNWRWETYDTKMGADYLKAMKSCITMNKPAIFTQNSFYVPSGYRRVTKGESWTGNYLLLPDKSVAL